MLLSITTFADSHDEVAGSSAPSSVYFPTNQLSASLDLINLKGRDIATAGTILPAGSGSEFPSVLVNYDVDTTGGSVSYARNLRRGLPRFLDRKGFSSHLTVGFSWSKLSGEEDTRFDQPAGSSEVGFLFTQLAPAPDDHTGGNFGNVDIQSWANLEIDATAAEAFLSWLCDRDLPGDAFWISRVAAGYRSRDIELISRDTFEPTLPTMRNTNFRKQKIDQDTKQVGFGGRLINPLGVSGRFDTFLDLMARVFFVEAELDSTEYYKINQGSSVVLRFSQNKDEIDYGLDIGAGAGWNLSDRWRATAEAQVFLNVPSISIINPVSGEGSNPGPNPLPLSTLGYDNEALWGLRVELNYLF